MRAAATDTSQMMEEAPQPDLPEGDFEQSPKVSLSSLASRKRPADTTDDAASRNSRKRAPKACHTCKSRKVKCSNERPRCAGCIRLDCDCVYPEQNYGTPFETAVPLILRSLNEILDRLPPQNDEIQVSAGDAPAQAPNTEPPYQPYQPSITGPISTGEVIPSTSQDPPRGSRIVARKQSPEYTAIDSLFRWPIFAHTSAREWSSRALFMADQDSGDNTGSQTNRAPRLPPSNDFDDISYLIQKFLRHVHIKNPILDGKTLLGDARIVAETGPLWDSKSCLVLLAAALGAIATPFNSTNTASDAPIEPSCDQDARAHAESYYNSACRRFGLLDRSITACQCHLLSGIYLMYTMRPIQAWQSFHQACTVYVVYLKSHGRFDSEGGQWNDTQKPDLRSLEQRLYWSCLKSESEVLAELPMPLSGLSEINYPHMFPSPPSIDLINPTSPDGFAGFTSSALIGISPQSNLSSAPDSLDHALLHEQSWFYYLTEISLLRLSGRINQEFYTFENSSWLQLNVLDMINAASEFERQLEGWRGSLPSPIRFWDPGLAPDKYSELHIATWGRYTRIKRLLYGPFLYRFVHNHGNDVLLADQVRAYAGKCIEACLDPIWAVGHKHRHHGTWFRSRELVLLALMLLSASKSGLIKIMGRQMEAEYFFRLAITQLKYWERESPDLEAGRKILEIMSSELGFFNSSME